MCAIVCLAKIALIFALLPSYSYQRGAVMVAAHHLPHIPKLEHIRKYGYQEGRWQMADKAFLPIMPQ